MEGGVPLILSCRGLYGAPGGENAEATAFRQSLPHAGELRAEGSLMGGRESIHWPSTALKIDDCIMKGKDASECANFVRVLHHYNRTHLLACGTGAFDPLCAFIRVGYHLEEPVFHLEPHRWERGRGKCPFDPSSSFVSTLIGGELFAGLYGDYWGRDAALTRSLGRLGHLRTEPDDERLLRGGPVTNDAGGQRILVNKWTTFLKARLVCSVPGLNGIDTYFDDLEDVFLLHTRDQKNPVIFGLFNTTSTIFRGHAICVYHMSSIREAFNGPYAHREGPEYHWSLYEGKVPYPRPGSCASKVNGGRHGTTKDYPDDAVRFARGHPLMYHPIKPAHKKPILVKTDGKYNLKQIAVDRVEAQDGQYDVLFIGTDAGIVLKIITIYNQETESMEEVILEELQIFKDPVPIISMEISSKRQQLFVASPKAVAQVRLHQCQLYGSACADCCLARDPYCAWDGVACSRYLPAGAGAQAKRRFRRQDVRHGNAAQQCVGQQFAGDALDKTEEHLAYGVENNSTLLECTPRSLQAKVVWFVQKGRDARKEEVQTDERVLQVDLGLLILRVRRSDAGTYVCQAEEHGFVHAVRRLVLDVVEERRVRDAFRGDPGAHKAPCPASGDLGLLAIEGQWENVTVMENIHRSARGFQIVASAAADTGRPVEHLSRGPTGLPQSPPVHVSPLRAENASSPFPAACRGHQPLEKVLKLLGIGSRCKPINSEKQGSKREISILSVIKMCTGSHCLESDNSIEGARLTHSSYPSGLRPRLGLEASQGRVLRGGGDRGQGGGSSGGEGAGAHVSRLVPTRQQAGRGLRSVQAGKPARVGFQGGDALRPESSSSLRHEVAAHTALRALLALSEDASAEPSASGLRTVDRSAGRGSGTKAGNSCPNPSRRSNSIFRLTSMLAGRRKESAVQQSLLAQPLSPRDAGAAAGGSRGRRSWALLGLGAGARPQSAVLPAGRRCAVSGLQPEPRGGRSAQLALRSPPRPERAQ
ncbi:semaphorin-3E [Octodon degus]|uniref:Semaphorin-3E n=1 Tax=Octodon degus TaxID=10160 RepID=A0A6P3VD25_OCTDE|nr:semaphorin-3E [Octodon degus]